MFDLRLILVMAMAALAAGWVGSAALGGSVGSAPALSNDPGVAGFRDRAAGGRTRRARGTRPRHRAPSRPAPPSGPFWDPGQVAPPARPPTDVPRSEPAPDPAPVAGAPPVFPPSGRPADSDVAERLHRAIYGLRDANPGNSAIQTLSRAQRRCLIGVTLLLTTATVVSPKFVAIGLLAVVTFLYVWAVGFRIRLYNLSMQTRNQREITEEMAYSIPDHLLPSYTVMVPAFNEPQVVAKLIESVGALDYPRHLLDIKLLLEEDDTVTVAAALASPGIERFDVVLVPAAEPRTKPKALNFGLQVAHGDLLTIYDAEDRPEPLQLRRAAYAMAHADPSVVCLQAELAYFNPGQNIITRWFTVEYLMWFNQFLPGLAELDAPIPLGGTSNHFRTAILRQVGGWDPFNVTEDADLGLRLHRRGYRTGVLASTTLEEANSDFVNWVRQRSRWYKGYLQAWLVHLRHPVETWRDLGRQGFFRFNLFVGGTPILALLNPLFWTLTIMWFVGHPAFIKAVFPAPVYYAAVCCWLLGNFAFYFMVLLVGLESERLDLLMAAVLTPVYWVMMSIAAVKAAYQLVAQPNYWEKTAHGLNERFEPEPVEVSIQP